MAYFLAGKVAKLFIDKCPPRAFKRTGFLETLNNNIDNAEIAHCLTPFSYHVPPLGTYRGRGAKINTRITLCKRLLNLAGYIVFEWLCWCVRDFMLWACTVNWAIPSS